MRAGRLAFYDDAGSTSLEFSIDPNSKTSEIMFQGGIERHAGATHSLIQTEKLARRPPVSKDAYIAPIPHRRKNLVVLRAGRGSLHPSWEKNISDRDRNWDLCLSWYGDETSFADRTPSEYAVLQRGPKWQGLHQLCYGGSVLFEYDQVAFPDDDLMMTWRDINRMFAIAAEKKLDLSQPSLTSERYISHPITRQQPGNLLRFTNFVEIMTPIFSRAALKRCAGTFYLGHSGWGLDVIWPTVLGGHRHRIGIIDAVGVHHTRPLGLNYDRDAALEDYAHICRAYGVVPEYHQFGSCIDAPKATSPASS